MKFTHLILIACLSGCATTKTPEQLAHHPEEAAPAHGPVKESTSIEAKELAAAEQATGAVEVNFLKGRSGASPSEKGKLTTALRQMKSPLKSAKIVSWGDLAYPAAGKDRPVQAQVALANQRAETLKQSIQQKFPDAKVEEFNMAERPGKFAEWYSSTDATLKKNLERAGVGEKLKASRAIIIFN